MWEIFRFCHYCIQWAKCWLINGITNNQLFRLLLSHIPSLIRASHAFSFYPLAPSLTLNMSFAAKISGVLPVLCAIQSSKTLLVNTRQKILNSVPLSVFILASLSLSFTSRQYRVNRCKQEITPNVKKLRQTTILIRNWNGTRNKKMNILIHN
jgi:hypothetical protein